ncbi:MAG: hypothetical protein JNM69_24640 [Archangium sp.]|nr:hypothetical protein [Archangium sp.]
MTRALAIDTLLVALLSALAVRVGSLLALEALQAAVPVVTVDGPEVLGRFQQRVGWACGLTPVFGWVALLPLHVKGSPSLLRRLTSLLLPPAAAAGAATVEVQRVRLALSDASDVVRPFVGVDVLPLARTVLVAAALAAGLLLVVNSRPRAPV